jgi:predicted amidohydrolase YtcJ
MAPKRQRRGGTVLTLDRKIGDFAKADVLIEGKKIAAVQPNIRAEAQVIDAADTIVMPGFVDTVLIAGKVMKRNGKLVDVDLRKIRRMAEESRDAVLARAGYRPDLFGSCCV